MSRFVAGHVTKMGFLKLWITSVWTDILRSNFKGILEKWWFTAHLSFNNYQMFKKIQVKSSFGRHIGGQEYVN